MTDARKTLKRLRAMVRSMVFALAALLLAGTGSSQAATIVTLSGSGDLTIEAEGAIYLDFGLMTLSQLNLIAETAITLGDSYPGTAPTSFDSGQEFLDLVGVQIIGFGAALGDVLFDSLEWVGSLTVLAPEIHGIGSTNVSDSIFVYAGGDNGPILPGGSGCPSGTHPVGSATSVITGIGGGGGAPVCIPDVIVPVVLVPNAPPIIDPGGLVLVTAPVPEPTSALLFAAGFVVVIGATNRRIDESTNRRIARAAIGIGNNS